MPRSDPTSATDQTLVALPDGGRDIFSLYDELLRSRDRLAGLPPLTRHEVQLAALAMNEVVWFAIKAVREPGGAPIELGGALRDLARAARDRSADLYTTMVAVLALKVARPPPGRTGSELLDGIADQLDAITFDLRSSRRATRDLLVRVRAEVNARLKHVQAEGPKRFRFAAKPELYRDRPNKSEKPDQFFKRVYGPGVRRGLTQADIRRADPAFYNVLHVWCSRNRRLMSRLVPASRARSK